MKLRPCTAFLSSMAWTSSTLLLLASSGCSARVDLLLEGGGRDPGADPVEILPRSAARVSAKWAHVCSIDIASQLHCWGQNLAGELGVPGASSFEPSPLPVDPEHTYREVSAGVGTTCAIRSEGSLFCWGRNHGGPLATGNSDAHDAPVQIGNDQDWEAVTMGSGMACGLRAGGKLSCWGGQDFGELAQSPLSPSALTEPTSVEGSWIALSSHWYRTMAIRDDGSLWTSPNNGVFSPVLGLEGHAAAISVGVLHALVVDAAGALFHLDFKEDEQHASVTSEVAGVAFGGAMASAYGSCSISADHRMYCTDDLTYQVPQLAPLGDGAQGWTSVGVGNRFGCVAAKDGTIWCWGTLHSDAEAPSVDYGEEPVQVN